MKINTPRGLRRRRVSLSAVGAAIVLALSATSASAAELSVDYDVNGTTRIASTGSTITLGPAVLHSTIDEVGAFTGNMALPGTRTEFKLLGFIPVTADVYFEPVGPTTGELTRVGRTQVLRSVSKYHVRLRNIKASIFPLFAGPLCRTKDPVVIPADTPAGEYFDVGVGGRGTGTYTIGDFQHCGLNTGLINSIIPGSGNTIDLNLTNGRIVG